MKFYGFILFCLLAIASCGSDQNTGADDIGSEKVTTAPESTESTESPSSTEEPETTTTVATQSINSADEARSLINEYLDVSSAYFEEGANGTELNFEGLEELGTYFAVGQVDHDLEAVHECWEERFIPIREAAAEIDGDIEFAGEVTEVIEVKPGLWITRSETTISIPGEGDQTDQPTAFVSDKGLLGGPPTSEDPGCWTPYREYSDEGQALFDEAQSADEAQTDEFVFDGDSVAEAAIELIEGDLAGQIGLTLTASCPPVEEVEVGTEFECTATTESGETIKFDGVVDREDHINLESTNLVTANVLPAYETSAGELLSQEVGETVTVMCGEPGPKVLDDNSEMDCTATSGGTDRAAKITITDLETGEFRVRIL